MLVTQSVIIIIISGAKNRSAEVAPCSSVLPRSSDACCCCWHFSFLMFVIIVDFAIANHRRSQGVQWVHLHTLRAVKKILGVIYTKNL